MKYRFLILLSISVVMLLLFVAGLGEVGVDVFSVLLSTDGQELEQKIFWQIRVPRVLMSALVGGSLALSGAVMQGIFRNPLADPGLVGVSAGSALGGSIALVLGVVIFPAGAPLYFLSLCAFIFGLLAMVLVYSIAKQGEHTQVATLLLAGVALSALCTALSALLIYVSNDQQLRGLSFWHLGSFGGVSWGQLSLSVLLVIPSIIVLLLFSKELNILLLGEAQAQHLGLAVEKIKFVSLVLISLIVSVSVSMVGVIGFVGLIVPHIIRLIFGADHRFLLPASFLLGALMLIIADTVSRLVIAPNELPVGIITALIGCPFFIYLLIQHRKQIIF
jgi:iron complex transport system permease protein